MRGHHQLWRLGSARLHRLCQAVKPVARTGGGCSLAVGKARKPPVRVYLVGPDGVLLKHPQSTIDADADAVDPVVRNMPHQDTARVRISHLNGSLFLEVKEPVGWLREAPSMQVLERPAGRLRLLAHCDYGWLQMCS